jgi:hypothetical protein
MEHPGLGSGQHAGQHAAWRILEGRARLDGPWRNWGNMHVGFSAGEADAEQGFLFRTNILYPP